MGPGQMCFRQNGPPPPKHIALEQMRLEKLVTNELHAKTSAKINVSTNGFFTQCLKSHSRIMFQNNCLFN